MILSANFASPVDVELEPERKSVRRQEVPMTTQSHLAIPGTPVDSPTMHATVSPPAAIALRLTELQSAWMRLLARRRLRRSIAHLDDRLLADIGLSPEDLGFAERLARSRATRDGLLDAQ